MKEAKRQPPSPEERTEALFTMPVAELAEKLVGMNIVLAKNPDLAISPTVTTPYGNEPGAEAVGDQPIYFRQHVRTPGQISIIPNMGKLFLINAAGEHPATCVRINKATLDGPEVEAPNKQESGTKAVKHFGLDHEYVYQLGYQDDSETLFLSSTGIRFDEENPDTPINPDDADAALEQLIK